MHEEYQHVWSCVGFWSKVSDDRGKCCLFFLSGHKNVRTLQITPRTSNSHLVCGLNDKIIDCFWHDFLFIYPATQRVHWLLVNNSIYHYFHSIKSDMHIKLFHCVAYRSMEQYRSTLENWVVYASTHCTLMITMVCEWEKKNTSLTNRVFVLLNRIIYHIYVSSYSPTDIPVNFNQWKLFISHSYNVSIKTRAITFNFFKFASIDWC